jgi:TonB-linked SusC/RagA family outer membrane protein
MKYYILLLFSAIVSITSAQKVSDTIKDTNKILLPFGEVSKNKHIGAVDVIKGEDLLHTSDYHVQAVLNGLAPGLIVYEGNGAPGIDTSYMRIRGQSRGAGSGPLVVIDGIANRALSTVAIDEIESIQVLKDITAKMLYGSKAANGVIMVNTKRGYDGKHKLTFFHEYGIKTASILPSYVNSAEYASLYNQALINDGKDPFYSNEQINNYKNNPSVLNPDVDFYDEFLKKSASFQRFNAQLVGGSDNTKFFLNLGYIGENGLENLGRNQKFNRLNVRGNLDFKVNEVTSMFLDIAGRMDVWDRANISNNAFFQSLSSHRPNDYPLWFGEIGDTDNLGFSPRLSTNLVGELARSGYVNSKNYFAQTNIGFNFDLNRFAKGLKAGAYLSFDMYNNVQIGKALTYSRIRINNGDINDTTREGVDQLDSAEGRRGDNVFQNVGLVANIDYEKSWDDNDLQINLAAIQQTLTRKSTLAGPTTQQDDKNVNLGLRANYTFKDKYTFEGTTSLMGSDKFTSENRWGLFGAGGFGWIVSKEDFLKDNSNINYLKLKGSFGFMGYDRSFDYLLYNDFYIANGAFSTGPKSSITEFGWRAGQIGNKDITFEKSRELNIGIEASLFKNKLDFEINYFSEYRYDIPIILNNAVPDFTGNLKPVGNFNEISNKGIDLFVKYNNKVGDLTYSVGANFIYSKAINEVYDEVNEYAHLNSTGQATDAIWGWQADGLYTDLNAIANHGVSSALGDIIPGDVKLENFINDKNDNIIDYFDAKVIGNRDPRINYSLNIKLKYKGLGLFVLGQGVAGVDKMLNNSYYWNTGQNKYSVKAVGSAVPGAVAGASSPRLTTLNQSHSYRNSTYWMADGSFFKLRTAELSYAFPNSISKNFGAENFKLFVRGNDLFTISKIKDADPENLNSGISTYPMYRTVSLGFKLTY